MSSILGERQFGRHFKRQFGGEGNRESKIAARPSGESVLAARHQDGSQGPLGSLVLWHMDLNCFPSHSKCLEDIDPQLLLLRPPGPRDGPPTRLPEVKGFLCFSTV